MRASKIILAALFGLGVALFATACGTIMHGGSQGIGIGSSPSGATVTIDNIPFGETPVVADLKRKDNHIVKIELEGFMPYESTLTRRTSGWVWGNIVFGGLIGLAVDAISGGLYKLTPDQVQATMASQTSMDDADGQLMLTVVLRPDPSWEKIGELTSLQ